MGANPTLNTGYFDALTRRFRLPTRPAEALLWRELKGRRLRGYRFERRHRVDRYVVDFYCSELHLAIDVLASEPFGQAACIDPDRTIRIRLFGVAFLAFAEEEVLHNLDGVVSRIRQAIRHLPWK